VNFYATLIAMRVLVLAAVAGCGFNPGNGSSDAPINATSDGPIDSNGMAVHLDAPGSSGPACYAPDPSGLLLCLELDDTNLSGSGVAHDGGPLHHDATVTNGQPIMRTVPSLSPAQQIGTSEASTLTTIETPNSSDFYVQAVTLMAWVSPVDTPEAEYTLIEKSQQWTMYIDDDGELECMFQSGDNVDGAIGATLPVGSWSLAACTYDGSNACAYVEAGSSGNNQKQCQGIEIGQLNGENVHGVVVGARWDTTGSAIDDHLIGSIDSVRIFDRALTETEICTGGGRTGC
jgi:hypothetical protein